DFIISYLYNKLPPAPGRPVWRLLKKKSEGHWYPDKPLKDSGFPCVHIRETLAAKRSRLAVEDVRANLPEELSVWIDPFKVSYQIGEKGAVKVLYLDDSEGSGAPELDKEIKSSFNPDAQVFVPIGSQDSSLSNSPSPSFSQSPSPTFIPHCPAHHFHHCLFPATTATASHGLSPTNNLLKHKSLSLSMHSLNFITATSAPQSQLSPNAKEFVYNGGGSPSLFFDAADGQGSGTSAPFADGNSSSFHMAQVFGGGTNSLFLEKTPFVEGLSCNLNTMQHPSQPFQPVVLAN
ncbi:TOB2-containing, partial [Ictidomys tridecemlineatus]|uniref:Protein Tob2-like n=1 Tax=Ictidomys tridecemlineatus TaxID=43179 RepID=A0A287CXI8_ICTTR